LPSTSAIVDAFISISAKLSFTLEVKFVIAEALADVSVDIRRDCPS
jgi:hypothetical protein